MQIDMCVFACKGLWHKERGLSQVPDIAPWVTDVIIPCSIGSSILVTETWRTDSTEFGNTKYTDAFIFCQQTNILRQLDVDVSFMILQQKSPLFSSSRPRKKNNNKYKEVDTL